MLNDLLQYITNNSVKEKSALSKLVSTEFCCTLDRSVYYNDNFAIRFCKAKSLSFSNTVLSLSALQKYDNKPFIVCVCTGTQNLMLLANSTFISKISHSSQQLSITNIKGSFNGSDILRKLDTIANTPNNFDVLFGIHQNIPFDENLARLVANTLGIIPKGEKFCVNDKNREIIMNAPQRAIDFCASKFYNELLDDLNKRTEEFKNEILISALIPNAKLRGEIIEYIIAGDDDNLRNKLIETIRHGGSAYPDFSNKHDLGDYSFQFANFKTKTDIKTKVLMLTSAPKGYNIDKMLGFLAERDTVFLLYFVGVDYDKKCILPKLVSIFNGDMIDATVTQFHWAGRNSRGATQFDGNKIKQIILCKSNTIDVNKAKEFLKKLIAM